MTPLREHKQNVLELLAPPLNGNKCMSVLGGGREERRGVQLGRCLSLEVVPTPTSEASRDRPGVDTRPGYPEARSISNT